jgi:hypothetical protein
MSAQDDDKTAIDRAYGDTIENLFTVFFNEFTMAHGDADSEHAAKERFRKGILHARHVREIALALVP